MIKMINKKPEPIPEDVIKELKTFITEEIKWIKKENNAHFQDIMNYFDAIQEQMKELTKKVDTILNIKILKERIEKI